MPLIPITNILVKGGCALKHPGHISHIANIPIVNVLVKRECVIKCFARITYMGYIPTRPSLGGQHSNVAITVLANTFVDIVGNTNTAIAKNTTKISDLKDQVDIDGSGFDVVLTSWNVSHVSDASKAFYNTPSFNQYIGDWNVSNVTNMSWMFKRATTFNQDIGDWDVGKVTDMSGMFIGADAFNQDMTY
jgi:surface protein